MSAVVKVCVRGPGVRRATIMGPASANLHNHVTLTVGRPLPVYPNQQTFLVFRRHVSKGRNPDMTRQSD
jgi:hypothetical protein